MNAPLVLMVSLITCMVTVNRCILCGKCGVTASIEDRHSDTVCGKGGVTVSIEGSHSDTVFEITTDMVLQTASVAQCSHNQVHV